MTRPTQRERNNPAVKAYQEWKRLSIDNEGVDIQRRARNSLRMGSLAFQVTRNHDSPRLQQGQNMRHTRNFQEFWSEKNRSEFYKETFAQPSSVDLAALSDRELGPLPAKRNFTPEEVIVLMDLMLAFAKDSPTTPETITADENGKEAMRKWRQREKMREFAGDEYSDLVPKSHSETNPATIVDHDYGVDLKYM